jgi:hypothetical protein
MRSVRPGDSIYVSGPKGPCVGKVVCHGKHGATVDFGGKRAPVKWEHVLGHKERLGFGGRIVDQGDDGAVIEDDKGRRHYVEGLDIDEPEPEPAMPTGWDRAMQKAMVIFFKGFPPGEQKDEPDEQGEPDESSAEVGKARGKPEQAIPDIKPGAMILFLSSEGDKLTGKVAAVGADGVTAVDDRGGEHQVEHGDYRPGESDEREDEAEDDEGQPESRESTLNPSRDEER